ncbi:hypothetical protein QVD17_21190 [Tagetes erecta]|uniref:Uncharacterized protein n=1 Tax=Tagetes erecta TaxID=13708 RepID=A0AAD8KN36_TARER|nr:hypothetical protein QVD17_21190 [Tagetes erecta]
MAKLLDIALSICVCIFISSASSLDQDRKVYIAYMGSLPEEQYSPSSHHSHIIKQIVDPSFASKALIRSYEKSFNGFAAYLSEEEKDKLTRISGIISVFPCQKSQLQTTRSWDFIGLLTTTERRISVESDIIIGVIDSGIWPESESFSDEGFGPIPTKWKGACDGGVNFVCNRKLIGARSFSVKGGEPSARDTVGHGTHTASIAAGNQVSGANYYGLANGIARGGVPSSRLAVYKVCEPECPDTNILSAFDHAIADGVDIITISISHHDPMELSFDAIAIGAFHAIERGILTVNSAGNNGPGLSSIRSYAPWILHVGASDTDRKIVAKMLLGNNLILAGNAINGFPSSDKALLPLVYGKEVTSTCSENDARKCLVNCLDRNLVEKKVVLCDESPELEFVKTTGALGCVYRDTRYNFSSITPLPSIALTTDSMNVVKDYKSSTTLSEALILKSEPIFNPRAPLVAPFSARGPSIFMPDILKPDVIAPGVEILAAFSPMASSSHDLLDKSATKFHIMSGTSMSCPHVAGVAAFIKSFHPEWSASAIKSAIMTTAWEFNASIYYEAEFAYGSGHIFPLKALNPGLVYETSIQDYLRIWCNVSQTRGGVIPINSTCPMMTPKDLNYPSMTYQVEIKKPFKVHFPRTVTNVGQPNSTYVAFVEGDLSNLLVSVEPNTLEFTTLNQQMNFVVTVTGNAMKGRTIKRMSLVWFDGSHRVRSPIVVYSLANTSDVETTQSRPS